MTSIENEGARPKKTARLHIASLKAWRAADQHTGIGKLPGGVVYTYEHVGRPPASRAEVYRIETYIPFVRPTAIHRSVH